MAEVLFASVPFAIDAIGGKCDEGDEGKAITLGADGKDVVHNNKENDYILSGDRLVAQPEMGIVLRVRIEGYGAGDIARVQIIPPFGGPQFWDHDIGSLGMIDFAYLPRVEGTLSEGRYLFSVMEGGNPLFRAAITLDGTSKTSVCVPIS
jgi:hypothetical protein